MCSATNLRLAAAAVLLRPRADVGAADDAAPDGLLLPEYAAAWR